ncbi:hypothetical protein K438DRAFT_2170419 [Mycena galopus ATCC 62051]|nr:hypothetical protein K438DRAFT_2170419 [Mycena galopus ATCC 62051]
MNATDGIDIVHGSVSAVYPLRRGRGKRETPAERGPQAKKFPGRAKRTVRVPNSPIIRGNGTHRLPGTPIYPPSKIGLGSMWMVVKKKSAGACAGEERAGKSDCPLQKRKRKAIKKNHLIMIPIPRQHPRIRGENGGGSACAWRTGYQHANDEISARKRNRAAREGKQSGGGRAGGKARGTNKGCRVACESRSASGYEADVALRGCPLRRRMRSKTGSALPFTSAHLVFDAASAPSGGVHIYMISDALSPGKLHQRSIRKTDFFRPKNRDFLVQR